MFHWRLFGCDVTPPACSVFPERVAARGDQPPDTELAAAFASADEAESWRRVGLQGP